MLIFVNILINIFLFVLKKLSFCFVFKFRVYLSFDFTDLFVLLFFLIYPLDLFI